MIGNDVVDISLPEACRRVRSGRFAHRVFTAEELTGLTNAPLRHVTFWALWSAKEAAFKLAAGYDPTVIFSPRTFQVIGAPSVRPTGTGCGSVSGPGRSRCSVRWRWNRSYIHCVASRGSRPDPGQGVVVSVASDHDLPDEDSGGGQLSAARDRSARSRRVRRLARRLLDENGLCGMEVVRPRQAGGLGPPRIYDHGRPLADAGVSLSHDGRWLAAALSIPLNRR